MRRLLLMGMLFYAFGIRAQEAIPVYVKGQLMHPTLDLSNIHIVNNSRGNATITTVDGSFEIAAALDDQLFITAVQIKTREFIITQAILESSRIEIQVEPFVNELDEVVVSPYALTGRLMNDSRTAPKTKNLNFDDVGIPGYKGVRREKIQTVGNMALNLINLRLDVEAVYKHLSGYYKRLRKKRALDHKFELVLQIIQFYGLHFLMDNYALEETQVYEFVLGALENLPVEEKFTNGAHGVVLELFQNFKNKMTKERIDGNQS